MAANAKNYPSASEQFRRKSSTDRCNPIQSLSTPAVVAASTLEFALAGLDGMDQKVKRRSVSNKCN